MTNTPGTEHASSSMPDSLPAEDAIIDLVTEWYWANKIENKATLREAVERAYWFGHLGGIMHNPAKEAGR